MFCTIAMTSIISIKMEVEVDRDPILSCNNHDLIYEAKFGQMVGLDLSAKEEDRVQPV